MNSPHQPPLNPWLIPNLNTSGTRLRLFCFPPAGAGAFLFRPWLQYSSPEIDIFLVQLPGREHRLKEACFTQLPALVESLSHAMLPYLQDHSFAFFGHSMGALISFELARQLRREFSISPDYLFVSGRRAPQIPIESPLYPESDSMLIEALRQYGGTPEAVLQNTDLMGLFLPIFRADLRVNETYVYGDELPLDCPITAFGGMEDIIVNQEQLDRWREHTSKAFNLQMFPGNHMFFKDDPKILLTPIFSRLNVKLKAS